MNKKDVNKPIKKCILWGLIAVLIIVVSVLAVKYVCPIISFHYSNTWKLCADYEEYADDFNLVKDYITTKFPNETDKVIIVSYNKENGNGLYDPDNMFFLTLPSDVASALNTICLNGFPNKDSTLGSIRINKEKISFVVDKGNYALVYSPDKRPSRFYKDGGTKTQKIQDGWYHVVKKD